MQSSLLSDLPVGCADVHINKLVANFCVSCNILAFKPINDVNSLTGEPVNGFSLTVFGWSFSVPADECADVS